MYDGTSKERRKENMARAQITRRKTSMKIVNSKQLRANLALTLNTANIQLVTLIITSTRFCFPIYSAIQPSPGSRWKSLLFLVLHVSTFRIRFDTEFRYVDRSINGSCTGQKVILISDNSTTKLLHVVHL